MKMSRRDFLKWTAASAVALGLDLSWEGLQRALADDSSPPILWLQGSGCSGCTLSFLNVTEPATADAVLLEKVSLKFHASLAASSGESALATLETAAREHDGQYILVVEGAVPKAANGAYCVLGERAGRAITMLEAVQTYAPRAKAVVAAGTCAAFGGICSAPPNLPGCVGVRGVLENLERLVNLPGCPVHPTALVQTLLDLILTGMPELDGERRPKRFFGGTVHRSCERRGRPQTKPGGDGCFAMAGCQGPRTASGTCPSSRWNGGSSWCVASNMPCVGCARPEFPVNPLWSRT